MRAHQPWSLVLITDWTEISIDYLEIGFLPIEVMRYVKHSEMIIRNRIERAACYRDDGLFGGGVQSSTEAETYSSDGS